MGDRVDTLQYRQRPNLTETKPRAASVEDSRAAEPAIRVVVLALLAVDGDEHLARIGDREPALGAPAAGRFQTRVAHPSRARAQVGQIVSAGGHRDRRLIDVQRDALSRPAQYPP